LISECNNLITNLKQSCPNKIVFKSFEILQTSQSPIAESLVIDAFEFIFPQINLSSFMKNVLPEIELFQDFFIPIHNCQSKATCININSHQVSFFLTDKIFFNTNLQNPFLSFNELTGFENPTIKNMIFKSLKQSIFSNRQNQHLVFNHSRESKERSFPFCFPIFEAFQIKLNRQPFNSITKLSPIPDQHSCLDNQLSRNLIFQSKSLISGVM